MQGNCEMTVVIEVATKAQADRVLQMSTWIDIPVKASALLIDL